MKAWELLDSPARWCQGEDAEDFDGNFVNPLSQDACCWCAEGALMRCYGYEGWREKFGLLESSVPGGAVIDWNDSPSRTWEEVHAKLKELDL